MASSRLYLLNVFTDPVDAHLAKHEANSRQQCLDVGRCNSPNCSDSEARFMGKLARVDGEAKPPKASHRSRRIGKPGWRDTGMR